MSHPYLDRLRANFREYYGTIDPSKLPSIAIELVPTLPEVINNWPRETLILILGYIADEGIPIVYDSSQARTLGLTCSNEKLAWRVEVNNNALTRVNPRAKLYKPLPLQIHQPNHIVEVGIVRGIPHRLCAIHPERLIIQDLLINK